MLLSLILFFLTFSSYIYKSINHSEPFYISDGRSSYPELDKGGALQISVQAFQVDYYPYHLAKSDRSHWAK